MPTHLAFEQFLSQFTALYEKGENAHARELLRREAANYPAWASVSACWEIAVVSRMGQADEALQLLEAALDAGSWFHEAALQHDPDFMILQGLPRFTALTQQCQERRRIAAASTKPTLTLLEPQGTPSPWPLLIALHGNASNAAIFTEPWKPLARAGWLVALPQSSQPSFASGVYIWDDVERSLEELGQHYEAILKQYSIDAMRTVVTGFSMGGQIALQAAFRGTIPLRGFVTLEAWIADLSIMRSLVADCSNKKLRGYLFAGRELTEYAQTAHAVRELMTEYNLANAGEATANTHHSLPTDFEASLGRALDFITG